MHVDSMRKIDRGIGRPLAWALTLWRKIRGDREPAAPVGEDTRDRNRKHGVRLLPGKSKEEKFVDEISGVGWVEGRRTPHIAPQVVFLQRWTRGQPPLGVRHHDLLRCNPPQVA